MALVFDVTQRITFQALEKWVQEARRFGVRDSAVWAVVANKCDRKGKRAVTKREAEMWAQNNGFQYFETSAKSGKGIDDLFDYLFTTVVKTVTDLETQEQENIRGCGGGKTAAPERWKDGEGRGVGAK